MAYEYERMLSRAFDIFTAKVVDACAKNILQVKLDQAAQGYVGISTGVAQQIGKAIIQSNLVLAKELIREIDRLVSIGGDDVPPNAAEKLTGHFSGVLIYLGELPVKAARDYLQHDGGFARSALVRIQAEWSTVRIELDQEFGLMVRKNRSHRSPSENAKTVARPASRSINSQVRPVHFMDFSGRDFERLVFAYTLRAGWTEAEWLGEAGGDGGRDISCRNHDGSTTVFLCANFKTLTVAKASSDLNKLVGSEPKPNKIFVVAGGSVSADLRKKIRAKAAALGFEVCNIWSGSELEEHIRLKASDLLERFCNGEAFPDTPHELQSFAAADRRPLAAKTAHEEDLGQFVGDIAKVMKVKPPDSADYREKLKRESELSRAGDPFVKYEGKRVKVFGKNNPDQYFVHQGRTHYLEPGAGVVCDNANLAYVSIEPEEGKVLLSNPGETLNDVQMRALCARLPASSV